MGQCWPGHTGRACSLGEGPAPGWRRGRDIALSLETQPRATTLLLALVPAGIRRVPSACRRTQASGTGPSAPASRAQTREPGPGRLLGLITGWLFARRVPSVALAQGRAGFQRCSRTRRGRPRATLEPASLRATPSLAGARAASVRRPGRAEPLACQGTVGAGPRGLRGLSRRPAFSKRGQAGPAVPTLLAARGRGKSPGLSPAGRRALGAGPAFWPRGRASERRAGGGGERERGAAAGPWSSRRGGAQPQRPLPAAPAAPAPVRLSRRAAPGAAAAHGRGCCERPPPPARPPAARHGQGPGADAGGEGGGRGRRAEAAAEAQAGQSQ